MANKLDDQWNEWETAHPRIAALVKLVVLHLWERVNKVGGGER